MEFFKRNKNNQGFSIIELLIVVAIVGILASIAIPSYNNYIMKSRRTDATTTLIRIQMAQERYRAENPSYASALTTLGYSADSITSDGGFYTITIAAGDATTFSVTATPVAGTTQASDTDCGTFTMSQSWPDDLSSAQRTCWGQ